MSAVNDLIAELLGNRYSAIVQNLRADVDTAAAALLELSGGVLIGAPGLVNFRPAVSTGPLIPTPGASKWLIYIWGAGGGGGGAGPPGVGNINVGSGGGSGGFRLVVNNTPLDTLYNVLIGGAGVGGLDTGTDGGIGGTTSLVGANNLHNLSAIGGNGGRGDVSGGIGPKVIQGATIGTGGSATGFGQLVSVEPGSGGDAVAISALAAWAGFGGPSGLASIRSAGGLTQSTGQGGRPAGGGGAGAMTTAAVGRAGGDGSGGRLSILEFTGGL